MPGYVGWARLSRLTRHARAGMLVNVYLQGRQAAPRLISPGCSPSRRAC
jgi:hypothetical protein